MDKNSHAQAFDVSSEVFYRKMFYILSMTAFISNVVGAISNGAIYGISLATYVFGGSAALVAAFGLYGYFTKKIGMCNAVILMIISWVEVPYIYMTYGNGMTLYFIMAIAAMAVFLAKKVRTVYFIISMIVYIGVMLFQNKYQTQIIGELDEQAVFVASIFTFAVIALAVYLMLVLFIIQYDKQRQQIIDMSVEISQAANMDALTRIYNRRYMTEQIDQIRQNPGNTLMVALLDIDDFKKINDTYGHLYGDDVLMEMGRLMKNEIRGFGFPARFGGEEFMLVFDNATKDQVLTVLNKIGAKLKDYSLRTKDISITFSGGIATYHNGMTMSQLFNKADDRLYQAKENGKNQVI